MQNWTATSKRLRQNKVDKKLSMLNAFNLPSVLPRAASDVGGDMLLGARGKNLPQAEAYMGPVIHVAVDGGVVLGDVIAGPHQGRS